jgi:hypothetical protein
MKIIPRIENRSSLLIGRTFESGKISPTGLHIFKNQKNRFLTSNKYRGAMLAIARKDR